MISLSELDLLKAPTKTSPSTSTLEREGELPVVARLVVEVRSDGSRTVVRGQLEDVTTGERTEVAARGGSPAALVAALLGATKSLSAIAWRAARSLASRSEERRNLRG